jgi:predicted nucleotidyltransferase
MVNSFKNIVRLKVVAKGLASLSNKIVFVGGAVVDLYADDPARGEVRPTDDIDVVIEILNMAAYAELEEQLQKIGFKHDIMSDVICRYQFHDITVDIMPNDDKILGFTNLWYRAGLLHTVDFALDDSIDIQIFAVPYYIATKIEALKSERHGKDYRWNSDFEDIIYVFDNRSTILDEIRTANVDVKLYLQKELFVLLNRPFIEEEIAANLERANMIFRRDKILTIWKTLIQ